MGAAEVEAFLTHLAVARNVSASTQNQAKSALLYLYKEVLSIDLPWLDNVTQAKAPKRMPVVLTQTEVQAVLNRMDGTMWLIASLLYGSGLASWKLCGCASKPSRVGTFLCPPDIIALTVGKTCPPYVWNTKGSLAQTRLQGPVWNKKLGIGLTIKHSPIIFAPGTGGKTVRCSSLRAAGK